MPGLCSGFYVMDALGGSPAPGSPMVRRQAYADARSAMPPRSGETARRAAQHGIAEIRIDRLTGMLACLWPYC